MHIKTSMVLLLSTATMMVGCGSPSGQAPTAAAPKPVAMAPVAPVGMTNPHPAGMLPPSTQPSVLKFNAASIKAIQAGTKTATIRKGVRSFPPGLVRAVGTDGNIVMLNGVTVTVKKFSELTEADAKANGSVSLEALKADLAKDYKGIGPDDVVSVVGFRLGSDM